MQRFASSLFAVASSSFPPGNRNSVKAMQSFSGGIATRQRPADVPPPGRSQLATRQLTKKYIHIIIVRVSPSFNWDVTVTFGHDVVHNTSAMPSSNNCSRTDRKTPSCCNAQLASTQLLPTRTIQHFPGHSFVTFYCPVCTNKDPSCCNACCMHSAHYCLLDTDNK